MWYITTIVLYLVGVYIGYKATVAIDKRLDKQGQ